MSFLIVLTNYIAIYYNENSQRQLEDATLLYLLDAGITTEILSVQSFLLSQLIIFPPLISMNLLLMQRPIISLPHTKKHFPWCYMLPPTLVFVFWHL